MRINRCERQVITKNHPKYKFIDEMCFRSKNLYNYANYIIRQEFVNNGKYMKYIDMNKELKIHKEYKGCMSQPANCTLRLLDKNWKSFFVAIKDYSKNPSKYLGRPSLPKYLSKDGRFNWMIPNNSCYLEGNELKFRIRKLQDYKWYTRNLGRLIQVRFVPKGTCYIMEIIYEIELEERDEYNNRTVSIDLGINNFVTMVNNIGEKPIIINGKGLKSINQYYNKTLSKEKSNLMKANNQYWSKKLESISFKRYKRVMNYMHNVSAYIIKYCKEHNMNTITVGKNNKWKQECNIGSATQKFIHIPYEILLDQLKYKSELNNIKLITTEESYTSGTSFIDNELPIKENYDKSRRKHRGMFISNKGIKINADVNGAYQIMRKVFPEFEYGIGAYLTPTIVNI